MTHGSQDLPTHPGEAEVASIHAGMAGMEKEGKVSTEARRDLQSVLMSISPLHAGAGELLSHHCVCLDLLLRAMGVMASGLPSLRSCNPCSKEVKPSCEAMQEPSAFAVNWNSRLGNGRARCIVDTLSSDGCGTPARIFKTDTEGREPKSSANCLCEPPG